MAIADFDDTQIQQFIQNWFSSEIDRKAGTADKCWELLKQSTSTKELAKTPLLLTFLCLVYDDSQDFPKNRATLYSDALDILLKKWAAEKRLQNNPIYRELGIDLEKIMLSEIAYRGFEADRLFFSRQEAVRQIQDSLASNENAPKHLDADDVLDAIAIQQGILVERSRDVYSFSHLTLQEYLTAKYINDHHILEKLVAEHLADKRWRGVFLLVAGLMRRGADELLLLMEQEAQKYINSLKLKALLEWADWVTDGSESDIKPVLQRVIAIAIATAYTNVDPYGKLIIYAMANVNAVYIINNIANNIAKANPKANAEAITNSIAISHTLEELKIFKKVNFNVLMRQLTALQSQLFSLQKTRQGQKKFAEQLIEINLKAFNLNREWLNFSQRESLEWGNYIYINYLIVQCKAAAVRVSPQTWAGIEERMLRVPTESLHHSQ